MSTSHAGIRALPVDSLNWPASLIQQLHELEKQDTDKHANEYFHPQSDDP